MFACLYLPGAASAVELVSLAQDFSPRFEAVSTRAVLVDASGLDRLVGDAEAVGVAMAQLARKRGLTLTPVLAPTRTAAMLMALALAHVPPPPASRPPASSALPFRVIPPGEAASALAPLPLSLLAALHDMEHAASQSRAPVPPVRRARGSRTRGSARNYRLAPGPQARRDDEAPQQRARRAQEEEAAAQLRDFLEMLRRWGLQTLGALAALPPVELFERAGTSGLAWQAAARGEDARPLVPSAIDEPFEATAALEWPVETLEPLSFVVSGLLEPLCARLTRAERGAAALQTTLQLVNRTLHVRRLELPAPMRDVKVLRTLVLLDLESHPPGAGIDRVTLTIAPTAERVVQHSLLARARPSPEQVATLTARLMALFGDARVGAPALVDSHAPGAFALRPFDGDAAAPLTSIGEQAGLPDEASAESGAFVLRRFRERVPARVDRARGRPVRVSVAAATVRGGRVVQAAGPWRTSGAWWDLAWDRDEWDLVLTDGTALRVSCDRESGAWFVDGVLD